jgi:hypothetical protein
VGNLLEYAFGTLANSAASKYRPTVAASAVGAGGVEFIFTRLSARTDVVYEVEYSTDMQSWTTWATSTGGGVTAVAGVGSAVQAVTETGSGTVSVKVRLAAAVGGKHIFARLRVSAL